MKQKLDESRRQYASALRDYMVGNSEVGLDYAYELGRGAMNEGLGLLNVVAFHQEPLSAALEEAEPGDRAEAMRRAAEFLEQALSPFEMTHRGFQEANESLRILNETLERRVEEQTAELRERSEKELREAYNILSTITEGVNDAVYIKDLRGRYLMINSAGASMFGRSKEEIIGKHDVELYESETVRRIARSDREVMEKGVIRTLESTRKTSSGEERTYLVTKGPYRNDRGEIIGLVGILHDITYRKQAEEEVRRTKEEAEKANYAKSEFLSRMSHELRTPMNAILGFAQLLQMDDLDARARESLGQILKAGRHLLDLINEVLDIARIEAGHLTLSIEPVDLGAAVREVKELIHPLTTRRGIKLEEDSAGCGVYALADRQRLKQVLLNLVSNSVKYNREEGKVTIVCEKVPDERVRISVRDTGPGIPPEKMDRLFTPFERLGAEGSEVEGTGIGLALSRQLVEVMRGEMGVESVVGEGSTFWMEFPLVESQEERRDLMEVDEREVPEKQLEERTVLYIEDNLDNVTLVQRIMERRGDVNVIVAMQGRMGLQLATEHRPDLILLDIHLPDINGDEVLDILRESDETRDIPVVVLSADATPKQIERLLGAGARAYLTKPIDVREFLRVLDETLWDGES